MNKENNLNFKEHSKYMQMKVLFIDRDGTINKDCPYCHILSDLAMYDDAVEIMKEHGKNGFTIIIITNQSGIGRGYFSEKEFHTFHNAILNVLEKKGVYIERTYYCPHRPEDNCDCRKPKTGMINQAMKDYNIDLRNSIIIGDRDDMEGAMARSLGMKYKILKR